MVLRTHLADTKVELFTAGGKLVDSWTSNGSYTELTGLETGKYYINLNDDDSKKYNLSVTDTAEQQMFNINILTTRSYAAIGGISAAIIALLGALIALIRRASRRRKEEERKAAASRFASQPAVSGASDDTGASDGKDGGGSDA